MIHQLFSHAKQAVQQNPLIFGAGTTIAGSLLRGAAGAGVGLAITATCFVWKAYNESRPRSKPPLLITGTDTSSSQPRRATEAPPPPEAEPEQLTPPQQVPEDLLKFVKDAIPEQLSECNLYFMLESKNWHNDSKRIKSVIDLMTNKFSLFSRYRLSERDKAIQSLYKKPLKDLLDKLKNSSELEIVKLAKTISCDKKFGLMQSDPDLYQYFDFKEMLLSPLPEEYSLTPRNIPARIEEVIISGKARKEDEDLIINKINQIEKIYLFRKFNDREKKLKIILTISTESYKNKNPEQFTNYFIELIEQLRTWESLTNFLNDVPKIENELKKLLYLFLDHIQNKNPDTAKTEIRSLLDIFILHIKNDATSPETRHRLKKLFPEICEKFPDACSSEQLLHAGKFLFQSIIEERDFKRALTLYAKEFEQSGTFKAINDYPRKYPLEYYLIRTGDFLLISENLTLKMRKAILEALRPHASLLGNGRFNFLSLLVSLSDPDCVVPQFLSPDPKRPITYFIFPLLNRWWNCFSFNLRNLASRLERHPDPPPLYKLAMDSIRKRLGSNLGPAREELLKALHLNDQNIDDTAIKTAYRKWTLVHHPDKLGETPTEAQKKEWNEMSALYERVFKIHTT